MEDILIYTAGASVSYLMWEKFFKNDDNLNTGQFGGGEEINSDKGNHAMDPNLESREGGIDLSNIDCENWPDRLSILNEPVEIYSTKEEGKYYPMFKDFEKARKESPTDGFHLVIPGLLPAPNSSWKSESNNPEGIWLMPNDSKPHHHGDAPHHMVEWDIDKVFELNDMKNHKTEDKLIEKYRKKSDIQSFYNGEGDSAIETWIHWMVPYDQKDYPTLIVKKYSIIWWDFLNIHNLGLVETEEEYTSNNFENVNIISNEPEESEKSQTMVTIMNKRGTFYFVCSVDGHAELGHKIVIKVI